jgi:hypothetical protein
MSSLPFTTIRLGVVALDRLDPVPEAALPGVRRGSHRRGWPVAPLLQHTSGRGLEGRYADDGRRYAGETCFVRGVRCLAAEHHFGGIVIQPADA